MEVEFEKRPPRPDDVVKIGMIDLDEGDRWTGLGESFQPGGEAKPRPLPRRLHVSVDMGRGDGTFKVTICDLEAGAEPEVPSLRLTEHGVAMLSSVLKSKRAVQMNILIVRAFVRLREILATHKDLARKLEDLEQKQQDQGAQIASIYNLVKKLITPAKSRRRPIGFIARAPEK